MCILVVPVMDHALHQISSAALGNIAKQVARLHSATLLHRAREEAAFARALEHMLLIGEHAPKRSMSAENCGKQHPISATNIHQAFPFREVVSACDRRCNDCG